MPNKTATDPYSELLWATGTIVSANEEAQDSEWKQLQADAALGKAVRRVVEGNDPKSSQIMAAELREYVLYSRQVSPDDELGKDIMLAIADVLEKEAANDMPTV